MVSIQDVSELSTVQNQIQNPDGLYAISQGTTKKNLALYGVKWKTMRDTIKALFKSSEGESNKEIHEALIRDLIDIVPTRTGHLYDYILRTMQFTRDSWYSSHWYIRTCYNWPIDRPFPITGRVKHSIPEIGYGQNRPTPFIRYMSPRVHKIRGPPGPRHGKSALYALNDPRASNDIAKISKEITKECLKDLKDRFNGVVITYKMKGSYP